MLQLLLLSDAHSRCLPPVRPRRHSRRPCHDAIRRPICLSCARIPGDFTCRDCGTEADFYRRATCARCALRQDLTALMIDGAQRREAMAPIVEALCRVDRPASILTWKRSPRVQELLTGLASGRSR